jgi:DNA-binding NtrC family response regulator
VQVASEVGEVTVPPSETNLKVQILIIEDEPSVGDALRLVLEAEGYAVVLVTNGHNGIAESRKRLFNFVIVDLLLTDTSGLHIIKDIHERQPEVPILLITGRGGPEEFAEAVRLGAVGALAKPFQPEDILTLIAAALAN